MNTQDLFISSRFIKATFGIARAGLTVGGEDSLTLLGVNLANFSSADVLLVS